MFASILASNSSLVSFPVHCKFLCVRTSVVTQKKKGQVLQAYVVKPNPHLFVRPLLRIAFGILQLREHVLTPDRPCCCCCDDAGEAEEEVLRNLLVWVSLCIAVSEGRTREFKARSMGVGMVASGVVRSLVMGAEAFSRFQ